MLVGPLDAGPEAASYRTRGRDAGAPEEGAALLQQLAAGAAAGGRFGVAARHTLALALVGIAPPPPPAAAPGAPAGAPAAPRPAPTARTLALFWERLGTAEAYAAYSLVHAAAAARPAAAAAAAAATAATAAPGPAPAPGPAAAPLRDPRTSSRAAALDPPGARAGGAGQAAAPLGPGGPTQAADPGDRPSAPGGGGPQAAAPRGAPAPVTTLLNAAHFLLAHLPPVRRPSCNRAALAQPCEHMSRSLCMLETSCMRVRPPGRRPAQCRGLAAMAACRPSRRGGHSCAAAPQPAHFFPVLGQQKASAPFQTWCAGGAHGT